jgi:hypothetical protein
MYKKSIALILLLSSLISFSQQIVNSIPLELKKDRDVFQVVNNSKKETSLFISDKKRVKAIRLNEKMQIIDSLSTERPDKKYSEMIGYNGDKTNPRLFWRSSNGKEIYSQLYNFENKKVLNINYSLPLKDEKVLQQFSENNKFYILSVLRDSNIIKLYVFDNEGKLEEKTIDLTGFKFFKYNYERTNLYGVLGESLTQSERSFSLQKIATESPTSLTESSKLRKCYSNENQLFLTFDTRVDFTQLITIDLGSYTATEKYIAKPYMPFVELSDLSSNSFLIDQRLYQVKLSSEQMILTVKDLNDNIIKEYTVDSKSPIAFKNSEIIQENGNSSNTRILEKTSQFLRKVNNSYAGISCSKIGDNYLITLGCVSQPDDNNTGAMVVGGMFGVAGSLIASAITYNSTYNNFSSYANRKVVYINCLFDKDANHINGELKPLAFDNIRKFLESDRDVSSQTIYKLDHTYYLGYYKNSETSYSLRKFDE